MPDYGVTWAEKDTNRSNRYAVAISSTGQYMVSAIGGSNKYICESDDYGATWTTEGYTKWYENICMSSDGTRQLAGGLTMQLYERFPFTPPVIVIGETWKNVSAVSVVKSSAWKTITNFSIDISNTWKDHS